MGTDSCEATRGEVYEDAADVRLAIPDCEHAEHWAAVPAERVGFLGWDDAPALCRMQQRSVPCCLPVGHSGDHCWCPLWCGLADLGVRHSHSSLLPVSGAEEAS